MDGGNFHGRDEELALLEQALSLAAAGQPQVVLVTGEAGVGKSRLIHTWLGNHPAELICYVRADPDESSIELAIAEQLMAAASGSSPPTTSRSRGTLPPPNLFDTGMALLESFVQRPGHPQTGVVFVDDLHWVDAASLTAIGFAARRLHRVPTLLIAAARDAELPPAASSVTRLADPPTGSHIHITGLSLEETGDVAFELAGRRLDPITLQALHAATRGNPLWIRSVAEQVTDQTTPGALPTAASLTAAMREQVLRCGPIARDFISALAVLGGEQPVLRVAALAGLSDIWSALDAAFASGLIECHGFPPELSASFTHPVIAPTVEDSLTFSERHTLHRAAAASSQSEGEQLWHLVACSTGPNPELAGRVLIHGRCLAERGRLLEGSSGMRRAAGLTADPIERDSMLLESAHAALVGGFPAAALTTLNEGLQPPNGYRDYLRASLSWLRGEHEKARTGALAASTSNDVRARAGAAFLMAQIELVNDNAEEAARWAKMGTDSGGPLQREAARAAWGAALLLGGTPEATLDLFGPAPQHLEPARITQEAVRGLALTHLDRPVEARAALSAAAAGARRHNQYYLASVTLGNLGMLENRCGNWAAATLYLDQALAYAETLDERWGLAVIHALSAFVPAMRGETDVSSDHLLKAYATAGQGGRAGLVYAHVAAVQTAHAAGDLQTLIRAGKWIEQLPATSGAWLAGGFQWIGRYTEALVDAGDLVAANQLAESLRELANRTKRRSAMAEAHQAAALVATARGRSAEAEFAEAARIFSSCSMPLDAALTNLRAASALRVRGRAAAAADLLAVAVATFTRLGAHAYISRAQQEPAACEMATDESVRRLKANLPSRSDGAYLTSQESVVAKLVADGLTNKEVAAQMLLSVRTVEFHLASIFRRLGIRSRTQLVAHQLATQQRGS